jgi:hypothetical protein
VRQVQRRDDGLAHVGVSVAGDGRQPRIHGIQRFGDGHETPALDDALHHAQLFVGRGWIDIERRHGCSEVTEGHLIAAQLLHRGIRVGRLVAGVGIHQGRLLLKDRLAQQRDDVLALGEPLAAQAAEFLFCFGFVQAEKARAPAVGEAQAVEVVQQARPGRSRKAPHRHHAQVLVAQRGRQAADSARSRPAARRCGTAPPARPPDSAAWTPWRAGRSASRRHRARRFPASRHRASRRHDRFPPRRHRADRASPRHRRARSRRAAWPRGRGIPPAAGRPASGDSRSRSGGPIPRRRRGVPRPRARTAVRESRSVGSPPPAGARPQ